MQSIIIKKIYYGIFLVVVLAGLWAGIYYKDNLFGFWQNTTTKLEEFKKGDISQTLSQAARQIFTPGPLRAKGKGNASVLLASKVTAYTNIQRFDNGLLPPLTQNAKLDAAALAKANDLLKNQYFQHVSPSGVDPAELVKSYGYEYIITGENLILGNFKDEAEVVQLWMDSPGHRANILNERYSEIGVAIIKGEYEGGTVWIGVQEFGLPLSSCPAVETGLEATIDANRAVLDQLSAAIDAKEKEINATSQRSPKYNQLVDEYNGLVRQYNALNQETKAIIIKYNASVQASNDCIAGE